MATPEKRLVIIVKVYDTKTMEWVQKNYYMQVDTENISKLIAGAIPTTTGHSSGDKEAANELRRLSTPLTNQKRYHIQVSFGIMDMESRVIEQGWGEF